MHLPNLIVCICHADVFHRMWKHSQFKKCYASQVQSRTLNIKLAQSLMGAQVWNSIIEYCKHLTLMDCSLQEIFIMYLRNDPNKWLLNWINDVSIVLCIANLYCYTPIVLCVLILYLKKLSTQSWATSFLICPSNTFTDSFLCYHWTYWIGTIRTR